MNSFHNINSIFKPPFYVFCLPAPKILQPTGWRVLTCPERSEGHVPEAGGLEARSNTCLLCECKPGMLPKFNCLRARLLAFGFIVFIFSSAAHSFLVLLASFLRGGLLGAKVSFAGSSFLIY